MIPRRVGLVVAAFHDEHVRLPSDDRYFRYEKVVDVPGDAPRRLAGDRRVALLAAGRPDLRVKYVNT